MPTNRKVAAPPFSTRPGTLPSRTSTGSSTRRASRRARGAFTAFERKWPTRCPRLVRSLQEGGEKLHSFFQFPKSQWKTLRTTNVVERLHEEFRRRVKTQGSLPTENAALVLLFGLVVSGPVRLRRLDGW
jgi:transposase-like protein